jgi:hypothetical protein
VDWFSKKNQQTLFPGEVDYLPLKACQIPSIVGDFFETIARYLVRSKSVSKGWLAEERTDLICDKGLIEVKSGYDSGKAMFTNSQWKYYKDYYELHNNGKVRYDIFYLMFSYKQNKEPFYTLSNPNEIYAYLAANIDKLFIFDHSRLILAMPDLKPYNFNWKRRHGDMGNTVGFYFTFRNIKDYLIKNKIKLDIFKVKTFNIHSYQIKGFEVLINTDSKKIKKQFRNKMSLSSEDEDVGSNLPEYGDIPF